MNDRRTGAVRTIAVVVVAVGSHVGAAVGCRSLLGQSIFAHKVHPIVDVPLFDVGQQGRKDRKGLFEKNRFRSRRTVSEPKSGRQMGSRGKRSESIVVAVGADA